MPKAKRRDIEAVDAGDPKADAIVVLREALARAKRGELTGVVVMCELPDGAFGLLMSESMNVAERLGRLVIAKDMIIEAATGDTE